MASCDPNSGDLLYGAAGDRRKQIVTLVAETGFRSVLELAATLGVSEMTIRRDIRRLAGEGMVRSVHGGASVVAAIGTGIDYGLRMTRNLPVKHAIARCAAAMVAADSVVAFDAGTTTHEIVRAVPPGLAFTAMTHSLPVIALLAGRAKVQLIGLGGVFHEGTQAFYGPAGFDILRGLRAGTLFLAATSIHDGAVYAGNPYDAELKRALIDIAQHVVLVADASKFSVVAAMRVTGLESVDVLVTDDGISDEATAMCRAVGVEVSVASAELSGVE